MSAQKVCKVWVDGWVGGGSFYIKGGMLAFHRIINEFRAAIHPGTPGNVPVLKFDICPRRFKIVHIKKFFTCFISDK